MYKPIHLHLYFGSIYISFFLLFKSYTSVCSDRVDLVSTFIFTVPTSLHSTHQLRLPFLFVCKASYIDFQSSRQFLKDYGNVLSRILFPSDRLLPLLMVVFIKCFMNHITKLYSNTHKVLHVESLLPYGGVVTES